MANKKTPQNRNCKFKVDKVMHEFKQHKLHSGGKNGPIVTNPKQAVAIGYSECRRSRPRKVKKQRK
jgi:hypothetical protein